MAEILIIEDDLALSALIKTYFESKQFGVTTAPLGEEGISLLETTAFDAVVMDVKMPGMSGTEALKKIKEKFSYHPPVILITGHGDKAVALEALRNGAFDMIEKPFSPSVLEATVLKAISEKSSDIKSFKSLKLAVSESTLSPRESEIALLASEGLTNEEIGIRLKIGTETVKTHLKNAFRKLGADNRSELAHKFKKTA